MAASVDAEFDELSYRVIGVALEVHHALGPGLLESMYHAAMRVALRHRGFKYESEVRVPVQFEGESIGVARIDLIIDKSLILELKAVHALHDVHIAQVRAYLILSGLTVGLLMNFNSSKLVVRRVVLTGCCSDESTSRPARSVT
ncbi:MAG TPA: GxxExxY protein [Gemmatimonadales bacterium]|nr:GxxExxY protein [Gemmatimonadales bacterium]